ncbi:MAG: Crp/Fnr family transcriptional regulator [Ferruginibacter sp.]
MFDQFKLNTLIQFDKKQLERILVHFKPRKVKRNTYLLNEGEVCKELYYVHSGCIRTFFIDTDGVEKTNAVLIDHNCGTAWTSFISQRSSIEFIETTERCELSVISYREFFRLVNEDILWKDFYLKSVEFAYLNQSRKVEALMTLDAKRRYQKLLKGNPAIIQKLSNKTLASFLHMREETLSRIKSKK